MKGAAANAKLRSDFIIPYPPARRRHPLSEPGPVDVGL